MSEKVITAASMEELDSKIADMEMKKHDKWFKGGMKGAYPERCNTRVVSSIGSSGSVRAVVTEQYPKTSAGKGVRHPLGVLGGGR